LACGQNLGGIHWNRLELQQLRVGELLDVGR
jgi:hypothetical protein